MAKHSNKTRLIITNISVPTKERLTFIAKERKGTTLASFMRKEIKVILEKYENLKEPVIQ